MLNTENTRAQWLTTQMIINLLLFIIFSQEPMAFALDSVLIHGGDKLCVENS